LSRGDSADIAHSINHPSPKMIDSAGNTEAAALH